MLKGEKVILRTIRHEDLQRQYEFNNDLEIELLGGGDAPEPQSFERLESQFADTHRHGGRNGADFAIEADGVFIGRCGLFDWDFTAHTCQLGIGIGDRTYWGRGYGRDAIHVLLDYAFRLRNQHRVWLRVNGNNERAIRAYTACGFVEEGRLRHHVWSDGRHIDLVLMGILRDDWRPALSSADM